MSRRRNLIAFWILGFSNYYGAYVMFCATHDIIHRFNGEAQSITSQNICSKVSTGILAFPIVIPAAIVKLVAPFLPFYIKARMVLVPTFSSLSFVLIAFATTETQAIFAMVIMAIAFSLGESSLLAYSARFDKNVLSSWSSGGGAAALLGSFSYAGLISIGLMPKWVFLLILLAPLIQLVSFFVILQETYGERVDASSPLISQPNEEVRLVNSLQKMKYLPELVKYMFPLSLNFVCGFLINQCFVDLIYFPSIWLDKAAQFRWLQFTSHLGIFVARSTMSFFTTDAILVMPLLNIVNAILFGYQAKYFIIHNIWIMFLLSLWSGLLSGCCYVNVFNRVRKELSLEYKSFGMSAVALSESFGVSMAGLLSIPIHNAICKQ